MLALTLRRHAQTLEGLAVSRQVQFLESFSEKSPVFISSPSRETPSESPIRSNFEVLQSH